MQFITGVTDGGGVTVVRTLYDARVHDWQNILSGPQNLHVCLQPFSESEANRKQRKRALAGVDDLLELVL